MSDTSEITLPKNVIDIMKKEFLSELEGKRLTIQLDWDKDWKCAFCKELVVSGFGGTIEEALESLARSINSTLATLKMKTGGPAERVVEIISSKQSTLPGTETHRFQELLNRKGLVFASGNGLTLDELCDFIEKTTPDFPQF